MAPGLALRGVGPAGRSGVQRPRVKTFEADPGLVLGFSGLSFIWDPLRVPLRDL